MSPLPARHHEGPTALSACASAYDDLAVTARSPVTSRRLWLQTWADCYPDWTPWVVGVGGGGGLAAVAPLAYKRQGPLTRVVGLGHGPTDDLRLPAVDAGAAAALADELVAALAARAPWSLTLDQVPPDDAVVQGLLQRLPHSELRPGEGMPTVRITDREPNTYLSKNTRKALAKIANRLAAADLVPDKAWTTDAATIRALLPELASVHQARDRDLGRRTDHSDPRAARFYREVITRHADVGQVDLLTVRLRGELAAFVCGFADGPAFRSWDNRLAPAWAELSAGRIANTEALLHVLASPHYDELDWMQGEEPYKLQSATEVVPRSALHAWSSPGVRSAFGAVERLRTAKRTSPALTRVWWGLSAARTAVASARRRG